MKLLVNTFNPLCCVCLNLRRIRLSFVRCWNVAPSNTKLMLSIMSFLSLMEAMSYVIVSPSLKIAITWLDGKTKSSISNITPSGAASFKENSFQILTVIKYSWFRI